MKNEWDTIYQAELLEFMQSSQAKDISKLQSVVF